MLILAPPNWGLAALFVALGLLFIVALKLRLRGKPTWRYDTRAAWLRAFAYFSFAWAFASATGTLQTIVDNPVVQPGQGSDVVWIVATVVVFVVVFIGYWIVWPMGTLPHGRKLTVDTVVFGLSWGISEGLLFGSTWVLSKRIWDAVLGAGTPADWATGITTIVALSLFVGLWHALYWDVHVSPDHNIIDWNNRKVLLAHNPNLLLSTTYVTYYGNVTIFVAIQAFALLGSSLAMPFPSARYPHPHDPLGPDLGPATDVPADLTGSTVVITGGAKGIGREVARALAGLGAAVVVVDINDLAGERTVGELNAASGGGRATFVSADVASPDDVRRLAELLTRDYPRIDVLINNAGIFTAQRSVDHLGHERTVATNHLGPFLLTQLLWPTLERSQARVLFVSSDAHRQVKKLDFSALDGSAAWARKPVDPNAGFKAYNQSKLLVTCAALELAERTSGSGVTVNIVAPGALVPTDIYREVTGPFAWFVAVARPILRTPVKASWTHVYLASSPEVEGVSGWYWKDVRPVKASQVAQDPELRAAVWDWSLVESGAVARSLEP